MNRALGPLVAAAAAGRTSASQAPGSGSPTAAVAVVRDADVQALWLDHSLGVTDRFHVPIGGATSALKLGERSRGLFLTFAGPRGAELLRYGSLSGGGVLGGLRTLVEDGPSQLLERGAVWERSEGGHLLAFPATADQVDVLVLCAEDR